MSNGANVRCAVSVPDIGGGETGKARMPAVVRL